MGEPARRSLQQASQKARRVDYDDVVPGYLKTVSNRISLDLKF
jgi:hypothetical protein